MPPSERTQRAQDALDFIYKTTGWSPERIAKELEGRVSGRTIRRYTSGQSEPQREADVRALEQLAHERIEALLSPETPKPE